jgi:threonine synthase
MEALKKEGRYDVGEDIRNRIAEDFSAGCASEEEAFAALSAVFERTGIVIDTHTAVAQAVYDKAKDQTVTVLLSTASPYKFPQDVLAAINPKEEPPQDGFEAAAALSKCTKTAIPQQILALRESPVRFQESCDKGEMDKALFAALKGWS